jgi:serine phosphatase RsbU (regulator of sigma subunit)
MLKIPFLKKPVTRDLKQPLPVCYPVMESAQFAARYQAARIGGDFFDVITIGDHLVFMMLDIAGKREFALNVAAVVQLVFREAAEEFFTNEYLNEADALTQLALSINRGIIEITGSAHFCTGFFGSFRESLGTLTYISAGHTPGFLRDSNGITELVGQGLPLGLFLHATHDAQVFAMEPGAVLLLYSRGVMEAKKRKVEFGIGRVREFLLQSKATDATDLCNELLQSVQAHSNGSPINNDLTTIALRRSAATAARS